MEKSRRTGGAVKEVWWCSLGGLVLQSRRTGDGVFCWRNGGTV